LRCGVKNRRATRKSRNFWGSASEAIAAKIAAVATGLPRDARRDALVRRFSPRQSDAASRFGASNSADKLLRQSANQQPTYSHLTRQKKFAGTERRQEQNSLTNTHKQNNLQTQAHRLDEKEEKTLNATLLLNACFALFSFPAI
jgi:hypothetical protein